MINGNSVVVVRDGKRVRVLPSGHPFDFTDSEVASVLAAGGRMTQVAPPTAAKVVVSDAPAKKGEAVASEEPVKPSRKRRSAAAETADEDDDLL
jgi:hypothetical protein